MPNGMEICEHFLKVITKTLLAYFFIDSMYCILGYWHQRADERHGNPPQR